jgi:hypothetical protein
MTPIAQISTGLLCPAKVKLDQESTTIKRKKRTLFEDLWRHVLPSRSGNE